MNRYSKSMQQSFLGVPDVKRADIVAYHDESGADPVHDRYLLQGILFVPIAKWAAVRRELDEGRQGYAGRIHFVDLRDRSSGAKARAAKNWIDRYFDKWSYDCPYKCMIADRKSPHKQISRHATNHDLYNYTTLLGLHGGIAWSFSRYQELSLRICSEDRSRPPEDDFCTSVPHRLKLKLNQFRDPRSKSPRLVEPQPSITLVVGDPAKVPPEQRGDCEFIQLVDLLTGAVNQAVNASASQEIKLDLGSLAASWIADTRLPPWTQKKNLHRRFSVSCFPDKIGGFFDVPLEIAHRGQMGLFEDGQP